MKVVVVRGHPGDIPGFLRWVWILGYNVVAIIHTCCCRSSRTAITCFLLDSVVEINTCYVLIIHAYLSFVSARVVTSLGCFSDAAPELSVVIPTRPNVSEHFACGGVTRQCTGLCTYVSTFFVDTRTCDQALHLLITDAACRRQPLQQQYVVVVVVPKYCCISTTVVVVEAAQHSSRSAVYTAVLQFIQQCSSMIL